MQSPAGFSRNRHTVPVPASSRVMAAVLTAAVYGLLALLWHDPFWTPPEPQPVEIVTKLVPDIPVRKLVLDPPPFRAHLIHPPVESIAPPAFTVATEAPPAPLPASAADTSPLAGGASDTKGQGGSSIGTIGNGTGLSGCFDAAWGRAVSDHIGHFFFYPRRAGLNHETGVVLVRMKVRRSGRLTLLEILKSSGNTSLDKAAHDMVRNAEPLPRIPARMHVDQVDVQMFIAFGSPAFDQPSPDSCGR